MELKGSQGGIAANLETLTKAIEKQGEKLDAIAELKSDVRDLTTRLAAASDEIKEARLKLDKVRLWIAGVGGVVLILGVLAQFAVRLLPAPTAAPVPINVTLSQPTAIVPAPALPSPTQPVP
ncbi:hypothetical protein [Devosia sp. CN2-171]|uniref:hypothetical protein n=1 Tax=Devosia sp. CN2-171 TaxID=3400909 RepID=UPI003BF7D213